MSGILSLTTFLPLLGVAGILLVRGLAPANDERTASAAI